MRVDEEIVKCLKSSSDIRRKARTVVGEEGEIRIKDPDMGYDDRYDMY